MRLLKISAFVLMLLGCTGWLMADIPDPTIRLSIPGGGSVDLCIPDKGLDTCSDTFIEAIGSDGFATIDVHNANQFAAVEMDWFFQTDNLDQAFFATSNDFSSVTLTRHFNIECVGLSCFAGTLEVDFSLANNEGIPGSARLDGIPCDFDLCPTATGFIPFSDVSLVTTYSQVSDPPNCCDGLQPDEHGRLSLTGDVPEPSSFILLIGAAGLLAVKSRFKFHRT